MKTILFSVFLLGILSNLSAQTIQGTVKDSKEAVIGASVSVSSSNGTTTDIDGKYSLKVEAGRYTLTVTYIGYATQELEVSVGEGETKTVDIVLSEDVEVLEELVVVGTRNRPRSSTNTTVPIDVLPAEVLTRTGQTTFDKALTYQVPSFNSVQTPVNDATSLLDPYEIRNMGPSRTLILINGKRKNLSALLYTQTSPGRGETGADISGIPIDAIKRVEILRDGASAQYGSDAIAGVMNIILKDDVDYGSINLRTGITMQGDGASLGFSLNNGHALGDYGTGHRGFINYTVDFSKVGLANRPGVVDAEGEAGDFGADLAVVQEFLSRKPDAGNINGSPETTAAKFALNGGFDITDKASLYFNAAYIYKNVNSFANYRTPYWRTVSAHPYLADFFPAPGTPNNYDGYLPTFDGILNDYNATLGFKTEKDGWSFDVSFTTGGNAQNYKVTNTHNRFNVYSPSSWIDANNNGVVDSNEVTQGAPLYRENSPISFDPGGTSFTHYVGNIDIFKSIVDNFSIAFGAEFRSEIFAIIAGDVASYDGGGADSFAGNRPENSGTFNRYNFGGYLDLSWDITKDLLLNGTVRLENYSDFGNAFVGKVSAHYKFLNDKFTLRASGSTGFRAPTLHQIYTQKTQYSFIPGSGIQVGGLINNVSPQARLLGIPQLDAEKSVNVTVGVGARPVRNLDITVDWYYITMRDRIVLSTEIGGTPMGNTPLDNILLSNNLSDVSFFVNALNTVTTGIDFVANYRNIRFGKSKLGFTLSGNYTIINGRQGEVNNPTLVQDAGQSVVNETQEALFFTSRPQTKWILGVNYEIGKFDFSLNNTYFGKTEFRQQGMDKNLKTEFTPQVVTDLAIIFNITEKFSISVNANNLFNILPKWNFVALNDAGQAILDDPALQKQQSNLITFNQRYSQMTYDGYHFSQLGAMYTLNLKYQF
jgi:iron complex outermembrane receptor protein